MWSFVAFVGVALAMLARACNPSLCPMQCADEVDYFPLNATSLTLAQAIACTNAEGSLYIWPAVIGYSKGYPGFNVPGQVSGCSGFNQTYSGSSGAAFVDAPMTIASKCTDLPVAYQVVPNGGSCPVFTVTSGAVTIEGIAFVGGPCAPGTYPVTVLSDAAASTAGVTLENVWSTIPLPGANVLASTCPFDNPPLYSSPSAFSSSSLTMEQLLPFPTPVLWTNTTNGSFPGQHWTQYLSGTTIPFDSFAVLPGDLYYSYSLPTRSGLACALPPALPGPIPVSEFDWFAGGLSLTGWLLVVCIPLGLVVGFFICCGFSIANRVKATRLAAAERKIEALHAALGIHQEERPDQIHSYTREVKDWEQIDKEDVKYEETDQEKEMHRPVFRLEEEG